MQLWPKSSGQAWNLEEQLLDLVALLFFSSTFPCFRLLILLALAFSVAFTAPRASQASVLDSVANRVYGQDGSFTTESITRSRLGANRLYQPTGMAIDSTGLYVADQRDRRVLFYPGSRTTAMRVYGQQGNFDSLDPRPLGADSICEPSGLALHRTVLYVADYFCNRVLAYDPAPPSRSSPEGSTRATPTGTPTPATQNSR
jgi:hypothetical protein